MAFPVERQKVFDPFARFLGIFVRRRNVEFLAEDQFRVGIQRDESLGLECTYFGFKFRR